MSVEQREAYDDADRIDSDPFGLWDRDNRNHRKKQSLILKQCQAEPGDSVLEVGCGDGLHLSEYATRYDVTAVDLSESLVDRARQRCPEATVMQADALDLPFSDDFFDAVVGTAVLHHLPDAGEALSEWSRVSRKSVTLMEPNYWFPKDLLTAHLVPEEQHKTQMAPSRLSETLNAVADEWALDPHLYSPPWPRSLSPAFDAIDFVGRNMPVARWGGQMLRIHIDVTG